MPRVVDLTAITPVSVLVATEAFGSPLRVNLIKHYREHPGPQRDAAAALGVASQAVSHNTRVLVDCGVVVLEPSLTDRRSPVCRVDLERLDELLGALGCYATGLPAEQQLRCRSQSDTPR